MASDLNKKSALNKILDLIKDIFKIEFKTGPGKANVFWTKIIIAVFLVAMVVNAFFISGSIKHPPTQFQFNFSIGSPTPWILVAIVILSFPICVAFLFWLYKKGYLHIDF